MIQKITQSEIDRDAVAALSDRPGAPGRYGTGGLSAGALKAHFDKLALLAIAKLNELIDALHGAGEGDPLIDEMATHAVSLSDDRERMPLCDWIAQVEALLGLDGTGGLPERIAALEALQVPEQTPAEALLSGYHPDLVAGLAGNLCGRENDETGVRFTYRPTRGAGDVGRGNAVIKSLHGSTLVFNQLFGSAAARALTDAGVTFTAASAGYALSGRGTADACVWLDQFDTAAGHKYLLAGASTAVKLYMTVTGSEVVADAPAVLTETAGGTRYVGVYVENGKNYGGTVALQVFDLTKMFGAGSEPTAEEFRALFPRSYYAYEPGRLLHFTGTGLVTVGFNQWDGRASNGVGLNAGSGNTYASSANFVTDHIRVVGGATYYLNPTNWASWVCFYDADKAYVGYGAPNAQNLITVPAKAAYARLTGVLAKKASACFHLSWSGWRNGEYEPYRESTLDLPVAEYFPTGMKSVGGVYDELTAKKAVQRIGTRAYAAGDENDATVLTDGATTCYVLPEAVETEADLTLTYKADDFGTEGLLPENGPAPTTSPLTGSVLYPLNAVDTVRNLPRNYVSLSTFDKLRAALAPWFTVSRSWNAAAGDYNVTATQVGGLWRHDISVKNADDEWLHVSVLSGSAAPITYADGAFSGLADGHYAAASDDHGAGTASVSGGALTFLYGASSKAWDGSGGLADTVTKLY